MAIATVIHYSRYEIRHKRVAHAPDRCGRPLRNGNACPCVPTYKSELGFACGRHVNSIEGVLPPPPPPPADELECPICYEMCGKDDTVTTDCNHAFCKACVRKLTNDTCPMCRQKMFEPTPFEQKVIELVKLSTSIRGARNSARLLLSSLATVNTAPSQWLDVATALDTVRENIDLVDTV